MVHHPAVVLFGDGPADGRARYPRIYLRFGGVLCRIGGRWRVVAAAEQPAAQSAGQYRFRIVGTLQQSDRPAERCAFVYPSVRYRPFWRCSGAGIQYFGERFRARGRQLLRAAAHHDSHPVDRPRHQSVHVDDFVVRASDASDFRGVLQECRIRDGTACVRPDSQNE